MALIRVLSPGFLTTVQDFGRYSYEQFGMPVSGAMDEFASKAANVIVGNPVSAAVLEITLLGPKLEFTGDAIIALCGANLSPELDGKPLMLWRSYRVSAGSILGFGMIKSGTRLYLSVRGGINVPVIMGSRSTYIKASVGGYKGRALKQGDELATSDAPDNFRNKELTISNIPEFYLSPQACFELRVVLGPQDDYFSDAAIDCFFSTTFTVSQECDRMGYRLEGGSIKPELASDIISDGVIKGAVQIPGNGQPIILMSDCQTAGGYPKIATVISSDLMRVAQAKAGDTFRFKQVTVDEAHKLLHEQDALLNNIKLIETPIPDKYLAKINGKTYNIEIEPVE